MKFIRWLDRYLEESVMLVLLALMVSVMGLQVFMRYVMNSSLSWPEELTRYMFIWFVFLGISYGIRYDIHIRVNIFETFVPKIAATLRVIQDIFFMAFMLYMYSPAVTNISRMIANQQHSPAMQIPMYFVYLSLLVGLTLGIFRMIEKYVKKFMGVQDSTPDKDGGIL